MADSYQSIAIVVAGGSGKRFGGETPKQFLPLAEQPLLLWTLQAFQQAACIDAFCVVVPQPDVATVQAWRATHDLDKMQWVVAGGVERQDSTYCGLKAIPSCDVVLVHDGARPLLSPQLIADVVKAAHSKGAVVPGIQVHETLKKISSKGHIITTVDRNNYATIQTPQGFRYPMLMEAFQEAQADNFYGTDEAMLIERMGFPVSLVEGQRENIKVTTPQDMELAEAIVASRKGNQ